MTSQHPAPAASGAAPATPPPAPATPPSASTPANPPASASAPGAPASAIPPTPVVERRDETPAPGRPPAPAHLRPLGIGGAILQLAALGVVGPIVFTVLFTLLATGVGLILIVGIGLLLLLALVYALYGLAWLEVARVDGLYAFGAPSPRPRRPQKPGFGGVVAMFGRQAIDASMWKGVANFAISTVLGFVVLGLLSLLASSIALAFWPLYNGGGVQPEILWGLGPGVPSAMAPVVGGLLALVSIAGLVGIAILHGVLSRLILVPSRETQLAAEVRVSAQQRAGAVRAADVERTRIERDLHDGVQPRLVSVGMTLGLARQKIDADPTAAKDLIEEAHTSTKAAITELRQLARGIHASVLDDRGLDAALSALAARSHVPVHLDVRLDGRCERSAEAAVYFAIAESLTNAAKHSRASGVRVLVRRRDGASPGDGALWARVEDDGIGGARVLPGGGLDGIANRILGAGGTYRLDSPHGGLTSLEVSVPCAS